MKKTEEKKTTIDASEIPLIKTLKEVPYDQLKQMGTLYVCSAAEWHSTKKTLLPKVLKELNQWFTITTVFSFIYTVPAIAFFLFSLLSSASKNILNKLK